MKNVAKKIYIFVALLTAVAIQVHVVLKAAKDQEKKVSFPKSLVESIRIENDHLATIADNALTLVQHIQKGERNETERKKALKNIDLTLKKLSEEAQKELTPSLDIIKQESQAFASHRKPLQKFSSTKAEQALETLTSHIKKLADHNAEKIVTESQQQLFAAINKTETLEKEANIIINKARENLAQGLITPIEAAKVIGEQNYLVQAAKRALQKQTQQAQAAVTQSDLQASYLNQVAKNIYILGSHALAPFKAGYGYTEEEKEIARAIIAELETHLTLTTQHFNRAHAQAKTTEERIALQRAFEATIQNIYNEIYQQKLITGDVMSTNRKLFWGAVSVAGALTAGLLGYKYLTSAPTETPTVPLASETKAPTTQQPITAQTTAPELPPVVESTDVAQQPEQEQSATVIESEEVTTPPAEEPQNDGSEEQTQALSLGNDELTSHITQAEPMPEEQAPTPEEIASIATEPVEQSAEIIVPTEEVLVETEQQQPKVETTVAPQPEIIEPITVVETPAEQLPVEQEQEQMPETSKPVATVETEETTTTPQEQLNKLTAALEELEKREEEGVQPSEKEIKEHEDLLEETQQTIGEVAAEKNSSSSLVPSALTAAGLAGAMYLTGQEDEEEKKQQNNTQPQSLQDGNSPEAETEIISQPVGNPAGE